MMPNIRAPAVKVSQSVPPRSFRNPNLQNGREPQFPSGPTSQAPQKKKPFLNAFCSNPQPQNPRGPKNKVCRLGKKRKRAKGFSEVPSQVGGKALPLGGPPPPPPMPPGVKSMGSFGPSPAAALLLRGGGGGGVKAHKGLADRCG